MNPVLREQFKKGVEQSISQGINQGKQEGIQQEAYNTTQKMLKKGYEIE